MGSDMPQFIRVTTTALGLVPGWLYALLLAGALAGWGVAEVDRAAAELKASRAEGKLAAAAAVQAAAVASAVQDARLREIAATTTTVKVADELHQRLEASDRRAADLAERLRKLSRPVRFCRANPSAPAGAASGGDGADATGLRGLAGADLVVLDGQARAELARLAASANDTVSTLKACRTLLRAQWRATQP